MPFAVAFARGFEASVIIHFYADHGHLDTKDLGRERNREVDFVVRAGRTVIAIEVKSGRAPGAFPGLGAFAEAFKPKRTLLVGGDGISLEEFLTKPVEHWLQT